VPDVEELLDRSLRAAGLGGGSAGGNNTAGGAGAGAGGGGAGSGQQQLQAAAAAAQQQPANEVDTFGSQLNSILAADLTSVALAQGSLDTIPLGPLATLMPLLQMAGQLNDPAIKSALKQVRAGVLVGVEGGCCARLLVCLAVAPPPSTLAPSQHAPTHAHAHKHTRTHAHATTTGA
jgi:hypothetical protein